MQMRDSVWDELSAALPAPALDAERWPATGADRGALAGIAHAVRRRWPFQLLALAKRVAGRRRPRIYFTPPW